MTTPLFTTPSLTTPFALAAYQQTVAQLDPTENLVLPTANLQQLMTGLYEMSGDETRRTIGRILHPNGWKTEDQAAFNAYMHAVKNGGLAGVSLRMASGLWLDRSVPLARDFCQRAEENLGMTPRVVDFEKQAVGAAKKITAWLTQETHGQLPNLIVPEPQGVQALLLSAAFFKGHWKIPFHPEQTSLEIFSKVNRGKHFVTTMRQNNVTHPFSYDPQQGAQIIELDFMGEEASLVVVLPHEEDTLASLETRLAASLLQSWFAQLDDSRAQGGKSFSMVNLPKYKSTTNRDLMPILLAMGAESAFGEAANMSGLTGVSDKSLFFEQAQMIACFGWNEQSTIVRSLTTGAAINLAQTRDKDKFAINRPFLYIVRDRRNHEILLMGRVVLP